jgi:hypothetical protein
MMNIENQSLAEAITRKESRMTPHRAEMYTELKTESFGLSERARAKGRRIVATPSKVFASVAVPCRASQNRYSSNWPERESDQAS